MIYILLEFLMLSRICSSKPLVNDVHFHLLFTDVVPNDVFVRVMEGEIECLHSGFLLISRKF